MSDVGAEEVKVTEELVNGLREALGDESPSQYQRFSFSKARIGFAVGTSSKQYESGFELEFDDSALGDKGVIAISEMLKQNCNLSSLTIRNDRASSLGAEHIGHGLKYNDRLHSLSLAGNNSLGTQGVYTLFEHMDDMSNCLLDLDLSNVGMGDEGCSTISNCMLVENTRLRAIDLSRNSGITVLGMENLARVLPAYPRLRKLEYVNTAMQQSKDERLGLIQKRIDRLLMRNNIVMDLVDDLIETAMVSANRVTHVAKQLENPAQNLYINHLGASPLVLSQHNVTVPLTERSALDSFGFVELCGNRRQMQDFILAKQGFRGNKDEQLYAVFDGHGGVQCVRFVHANFADIFAEELNQDAGRSVCETIIATFERIQTLCEEFGIPHGTCAMVCYVQGKTVYSACCGDSRAVLAKKDAAGNVSVDRLSQLLTPRDSEERSRIEAQGGFVTRHGRVCGVLAVSRAIGDKHIPCVSSTPTITTTVLRADAPTQIMTVASDGVWNVLTPLEAAEIVTAVGSPYYAASLLCDCAYRNGSNDNISIICIKVSP